MSQFTDEFNKNINLTNQNDDLEQYTPKIGVLGLGGAGTNTVELLQQRLGENVRCIICNTDVQSVRASTCKNKILLGPNTTRGKGAGGKPAVGKAATEESLDEIMHCIKDLDMIIIVAGAGGGTGSGSAQVVGKAAIELGILTIAIITSPFTFEGSGRDAVAEKCIRELEDNVDTLVVNKNQQLLEMTKGKTTLAEAFTISDKFSADCVEDLVSIIQDTGVMNVDFADFCSVIRNRKSKAIMGTGYAEGEGAGLRAIDDSMSSFLLACEHSWSDVDNVVLCIRGGSDLSMEDFSTIGDKVRMAIHPDANIIIGARMEKEVTGWVRIFVIGTTRRKSGATHGTQSQKTTQQNHSPSIDYQNINYTGSRCSLNEYREKFEQPSSNKNSYSSNDTAQPTPKAQKKSWWHWGSSNDKKHTSDLPEFLQPE